LERRGNKRVRVLVIEQNDDRLAVPDRCEWLEFCAYSIGAAIGRCLKNAICSFGRTVALIVFIVMITQGGVAGRLNLVEEVMHPMRRGVDEKKQKS
jgi:hypothetical protein